MRMYSHGRAHAIAKRFWAVRRATVKVVGLLFLALPDVDTCYPGGQDT